MKGSVKPWQELNNAREALHTIMEQNNVNVERYWQLYLIHLNRVWNKAANHFGNSPKWDSWSKPYWDIKTNDPLLAYLRMARGDDEHTAGSILIHDRPALRTFKPGGPPNTLRIRKAQGADGKTYTKMTLERMTLFNVETRLATVSHGKKTYDPPKTHLGKQIDPTNLIAIAQMGLDWHAAFLTAAEKEFVDE